MKHSITTSPGNNPFGTRNNLAAKNLLLQLGSLLIFPLFALAAKSNRTESGAEGGEAYEEIKPSGTLLVGFKYRIADLSDTVHVPAIKALQPIYQSAQGLILGELQGEPGGTLETIQAKKGYAVGGIQTRAGWTLDRFKIRFTRVIETGGALNPKDAYESEWLGGWGGGRTTTMGYDSQPVVGIFGKKSKIALSIGLVYLDNSFARPGDHIEIAPPKRKEPETTPPPKKSPEEPVPTTPEPKTASPDKAPRPTLLKPDREWNNTQGQSFTGTYRRCDGTTVWIRSSKGEVSVPLASLASDDQAAVGEFQRDFSWKLPSAKWPGVISAPATRPAGKVIGLPRDALPVYRTFSFEFQSDQELSPQVVGEFGRTFEATSELFAHLPWDIRPAPPDGKYQKVRLYSKRADFMTALGVTNVGSAQILGLYRPSDRIIHIPLESLLEGRSLTNGTLRHELAHQMMHDMLSVIPWWVAEGTAEYVRIIPWSSAGYDCSAVNKPAVMKSLAAEGPLDRQAFKEILTDSIVGTLEAHTTHTLTEARAKLKGYLLDIRQDRADMLAGKKTTRAVKGIERKLQAGTIFHTAKDEGRALMLRYHAAKTLVYYLQHLEGDGKGAKMLSLMWHLRQWTDELNAQRPPFEKKAEEFRTAFTSIEDRLKAFSKMETAYQEALRNWKISNSGRSTNIPKPLAPEEELLNLLPNVPDCTPFTAVKMQARWDEIASKTLVKTPDAIYEDIIKAFKNRKIEFPRQ